MKRINDDPIATMYYEYEKRKLLKRVPLSTLLGFNIPPKKKWYQFWRI
jgi:hypothetical protein